MRNKKEQTYNKDIALEVIHFNKKYRGRNNYAVRDASFVVKAGEFHGFIGANGAGKTTSIKSIIGAYAKFGGEIKIFGLHHRSKEAKNKIGYIPEKADFPKGMSLHKYLYYMATLSGLNKKSAKEFANEKISEFGLENVKKDSPNSFSSGQKKKVLLAQALVSNPDLIIMDEPAANLDPKARKEFFDELKRLQKEGKTIFLSSHILTELDQFVDSITILDNGQMVYSGSVADVSKGKVLRYKFKLAHTKDKPAFIKLINKSKNKKGIDKYKNVNVIFKTKDDMHKFATLVHKSNIELEGYERVVMNLQEVYNKFVKVGSVDTPEHLKKLKKDKKKEGK